MQSINKISMKQKIKSSSSIFKDQQSNTGKRTGVEGSVLCTKKLNGKFDLVFGIAVLR